MKKNGAFLLVSLLVLNAQIYSASPYDQEERENPSHENTELTKTTRDRKKKISTALDPMIKKLEKAINKQKNLPAAILVLEEALKTIKEVRQELCVLTELAYDATLTMAKIAAITEILSEKVDALIEPNKKTTAAEKAVKKPVILNIKNLEASINALENTLLTIAQIRTTKDFYEESNIFFILDSALQELIDVRDALRDLAFITTIATDIMFISTSALQDVLDQVSYLAGSDDEEPYDFFE